MPHFQSFLQTGIPQTHARLGTHASSAWLSNPKCGLLRQILSVPLADLSRSIHFSLHPCLCPCPVYPPLLIPLAWHHPASDAPYSLLFPHAAEGACEHLSQVTLPLLRALCGSVLTRGKDKAPTACPHHLSGGSFQPLSPLFPGLQTHRPYYSLLLPQGLCTCCSPFQEYSSPQILI